MSYLVLNYIIPRRRGLPRNYWVARTESNGNAYLNIGKLKIPKAYLGKRLRLRAEVEVL